MRSVRCFLGTISIRVGIIAVRVVVVRGAGIHGIENNAEDSALDAIEKVACASESFLGGFAATNDDQHAIGLHGKNHGIGGGHDGGRINDDELELGAEFGDGLDELVGREQVRGIRRKRPGRNGDEIGNCGVRNGHQIET